MGVFTAAFLTLAMLLALQYVQDTKLILFTGAIVLVLSGNVILFFRDNMIDRHSESLCFDGGRCYSVTKSGATSGRSSVRLRFKREMVTIRSDQEKEHHAEPTPAFQVLDRQDWKAIKQLSARQAGRRESRQTFPRPVVLLEKSYAATL